MEKITRRRFLSVSLAGAAAWQGRRQEHSPYRVGLWVPAISRGTRMAWGSSST
jgi:hypothetical protein